MARKPVKKTEMTENEKIQYLRIALALQKISVSDEVSERIIVTYEVVLALGGDFTLRDAVNIQCEMDRKYAKKKLKS